MAPGTPRFCTLRLFLNGALVGNLYLEVSSLPPTISSYPVRMHWESLLYNVLFTLQLPSPAQAIHRVSHG